MELSERRRELVASLIASPLETVQITRSKRLTYQRFSKVIPTPQVWNAENAIYPAFLKPEVGQGSKGVCIARHRQELDVFLQQDPSRMVLEYLPGEEYTVDCFSDRHGRLRFAGVRSRQRILNGISVGTSRAVLPELEAMAETIHRQLPFRGAWFFQVKRSSAGVLTLLEIAPRIAGSSALHRILGVNLPVLTLYDHLGQDVVVQCQSFDAELDRAWSNRYRLKLQYDHVYLDFDDCLCIDDRLNPLAMRLVIQAVNQGKRVHVLSRHRKGCLKERLKQLRILELFDEVIQIEAAHSKADFVVPNSIFIDDSFAERQAVAEKQIPVFAVDAIESLLEDS